MEETNQQVEQKKNLGAVLYNFSELLLFRFIFLFLPPLLTDAFVTRKKEKRKERRRRPLFCLLFFHLVYSRFDLHHRDDDDYLHFSKQKTNGKILTSCFLLLSIFVVVIHFQSVIFERRYLCRGREKLVATVLYIQRRKKQNKKWGFWWAVAWHLFDTWHRAHRISDSR